MLKAGDVGFVMHTENWISKVIAWFMGSQWSHSFMVLEVTPERVYLVETSDFQVVYSELSKYTLDPRARMEVRRPAYSHEGEGARAAASAALLHGQIYGYLQLPSLGFRALLRRAKIRIKNVIRQGLVCCAVPLTGLSATSLKPFAGIDPESIDTEELYQMLLPVSETQLERGPN